jgi:hypothetical protein
MKTILFVAAALLLGGCAGISDHHVSYLNSKCEIFGFDRGSAAHSACYQKESDLWWDRVKDQQL